MSFFFRGIDDKKLFVNEWTVQNPLFTVQIVHGMAEHSARYAPFAKFLNKNNISVYASDHRSHGNSREDYELLGDIGINGFEHMVDDQYILAQKIKEENNCKHIILGHSMGSFVSQRLVQKYPHILDALILSGSSSGMEFESTMAELLAKFEKSLFGNRPSRLMDKLVFMGYNKKTDKKTEFDWLSRDEKEVEKYRSDRYCGFICPNNLFIYLSSALKTLWKREELEKIPKNLPIFIFGGDMDPVGKYGKGLKLLHDLYSLEKIENLSLKIYKGGRHEMLNEINRDEVYDDILNFIANLK